MKTMKTICNGCQKVLTDGATRLFSANFSSALKTRKQTKWVTWAHCDGCYKAAWEAKAFKAAIKELKSAHKHPDQMQAHIAADSALCGLLRALGYDEVVEEFEMVEKSYD